jgi:hypothetical protein
MTDPTRRDFIKTSGATALAIAAGGCDWSGGHAPQNSQPATTAAVATTGKIGLTIHGLCALVKTADGVDILLPTAPGHQATFVHPGGTEIVDGFALTLSGLPSGAVQIPAQAPCDTEHRWFADLNKLYPGSKLVNYRQPQTPRKVASFLPLSGGAVQIVVSVASAVPGIDNVWDLAWIGSTRQLLVEVATYTVTVPAGTYTFTMTPMGGGPSRTIPLTVTANQDLSLTIGNERPPMGPRNQVGFLQHFNNHANIFDPPPAQMTDPRSTDQCKTSQAAHLIAPDNKFLDAFKRLRTAAQGAGSIPLINNQVYLMTADDPICPLAYFNPDA